MVRAKNDGEWEYILNLIWSLCRMSYTNVSCSWSTCYSSGSGFQFSPLNMGLVCLLFLLSWYVSHVLQFSIAVISPSWLMRSHWTGKGSHMHLGKGWAFSSRFGQQKVHPPRKLLQWFEQGGDEKATSNTADRSCEFGLIQIPKKKILFFREKILFHALIDVFSKTLKQCFVSCWETG